MRPDEPVTIIGAGLAGALLATLLAQRGWSVDVLEKRPDPRRGGYAGGRSINLALAERGLAALRQAGLEDEIMAQAVMMRGRMVHFAEGGAQLQRYGRDDSEVIWSVHRGRLNITLLDAAERAGATLHFDSALHSVDFATCEMMLAGSESKRRPFTVLIGADGAGSALRQSMAENVALGERFDPLGHGYKELEIPPTDDGSFRIEPNALHIWPRGGYMCIALPNSEKSFTVTLFLPNEGDPSFASVRSGAEVRALFQREFPDALPLIPQLESDFERNPTGQLGTLRLERWALDGKAVLIGDAAHAMVPFHGQGMNCAFEDCVALADTLADSRGFADAFARYEQARRANAEAIQAMALENYIEMRDRVDDADFLLQRELERLLAERHPDRFLPRYAMVMFTRMPYAVARERGEVQRHVLTAATAGRSQLGEVDLDAVDRLVQEQLSPL
jgi:kynurenine 3-monooxygenase